MLNEERLYLIEEACGVFGIFHHKAAAKYAYFGIHALQHRGQESAGIVTLFEEKLYRQCGLGKVKDALSFESIDALKGESAIGHVRYSTVGESTLQNAQPLIVATKFGKIALAHNGNITNAFVFRKALENQGHVFTTQTDTEVIAHLIDQSAERDLLTAIIDTVKKIEGAFSLLIMSKEFTVSLRDSAGVRPLSMGRIGDGGARVVASESVSFDLINAVFERDIQPGELFVCYEIGEEKSFFPFDEIRPFPCVFELVYFARPDSIVFGRSVYRVRKKMGERLAEESPALGDIVIAIPDSGIPAALGFSHFSGIPFEVGFVRSPNIGRTFIEPKPEIRNIGVELKLSPIREVLNGRRVIVVDDSIVRGTTSKKIISLLRDAGAAEVHFRVASPPTTHPCFYGIDTSDKKELVAHDMEKDQIRDFIGADSLAYLSLKGLFEAVKGEKKNVCAACFTGDYPV